MSQNGKTYHDLLAGEGEELAFLIICHEYKKAFAIIEAYEESEGYRDKSDPDLYISILFFKAWLASEHNFVIVGNDIDEEPFWHEAMDFVPSSPRQKVLQLITRQFTEYDNDYRLLKKALQICRKDPSLLRERALALHFFEDCFDSYEESGAIYAREQNVCLEVLYGPSSWQKLFSNVRLAKTVVRNDGKEKGLPMCLSALDSIRKVDGQHRLLVALALYECAHYFSDDEAGRMRDERVRIVAEHGSADNPLADTTIYLNDKTLLSQKLLDAEKRGDSAEDILTLFYRNSMFLPDDEAFKCFDVALRNLAGDIDHECEAYKKAVSCMGYMRHDIKDHLQLRSYFLEKAEAVDTCLSEPAFRSFLDVVKGLEAPVGFEVVSKVEKKLPPDHRYEYILLGFKTGFLRSLGLLHELSLCNPRLVKGYEAMDIEKDEAYYLAYYEMGTEAREKGKTSRFLRYVRKAADGLERLLGLAATDVRKCYLDLEDHYCLNGSDEESFDYVISIYDRLVDFYEGGNNIKWAFNMMADKAEYLLRMGRSAESLEEREKAFNFTLEKAGPLSTPAIEARHNFSLALFMNKENDRALALLEESNRILPDGSAEKIECQAILMMIYHSSGHREEAYAIARSLKPLEKKLDNPQKGVLYQTLADMYADMEDYRMANRMKDKVDRILEESLEEKGGFEDGRVPYFMPTGRKFQH